MVRSILAGLKANLAAEHVRRFEEIDTEDFSGVRRKVAEHFEEMGLAVTDDYLDRGIYALKQYYAMIVVDPANIHATSRQIDPFWHMHILHTRQYMAFCERVTGEYIHHFPLDKTNSVQMGAIRPISGDTSKKVPTVFETVDRDFWPKAFTDADVICADPCSADYAPDLQPIALFEHDSRLQEHGDAYRSAV